jgi:hypothetical protein
MNWHFTAGITLRVMLYQATASQIARYVKICTIEWFLGRQQEAFLTTESSHG